MKKIHIFLILGVFIFLSFKIPIFAANTNFTSSEIESGYFAEDTPENVLKNVYTALNNGDYYKYMSLIGDLI